jgi:transcriptional regulator with XRE-family HTH domain
MVLMISPIRLKLARITADLKQHEVSAQLQVSTNYVSMIERGLRQPSLAYLQAFATLVDIPLSFLLWDPATSPQKPTQSRKVEKRIEQLLGQYALSTGVSRPAPKRKPPRSMIKNDSTSVARKNARPS